MRGRKRSAPAGLWETVREQLAEQLEFTVRTTALGTSHIELLTSGESTKTKQRVLEGLLRKAGAARWLRRARLFPELGVRQGQATGGQE